MALVAGLSAGLCEEGARWIVLTFFLKQVRRWDQGLQYGAGHGGVEAIIFGVLALLELRLDDRATHIDPSVLNLAGAAAGQAQAQMAQYWATPWYMSILAGLERVFAITLQIAMALLVVRSVARRQPLYLLAAIGLHTAVDFWAVWGASNARHGLGGSRRGCLCRLRLLADPAAQGTVPGTRRCADPSADHHRRRSHPTHPFRRRPGAAELKSSKYE